MEKETLDLQQIIEILGQRPFPAKENYKAYLDTKLSVWFCVNNGQIIYKYIKGAVGRWTLKIGYKYSGWFRRAIGGTKTVPPWAFSFSRRPACDNASFFFIWTLSWPDHRLSRGCRKLIEPFTFIEVELGFLVDLANVVIIFGVPVLEVGERVDGVSRRKHQIFAKSGPYSSAICFDKNIYLW